MDEAVMYLSSGRNMKLVSSAVWRMERIDPGGGEGDVSGSNEQESVLG